MSTAVDKAMMADPAPLGLAAFAFTTFLLSFSNAGWLPEATVAAVLPLAFSYGGLCQLLTGIFEMRKGNTFGFTAFCSYGAFWLFFALMVLLAEMGIAAPPPEAIGTALILWGIFTFYMWIPAMTTTMALNLTFLFLWITFFLLGSGALLDVALLTKLGGYLGIATAMVAAYASFAIVTNSVVGAGTVPLGRGISWKKR
ncbi:MAG TPA: acetate uptake transporter [Conexivisphaerales archaeon]|nr:acetate uptake transporter [Conexivisphaerales archaeon]